MQHEKNYSMATDWPALRVEYVNSAQQYKELAERHGLKEATVRQRANREGWVEERHALSRVVTERASQDLTLARSDDLAKFNADDLRMARAIRAKVAQMMARVNFPADLRALASAVDTAQKIGRLALGASTENATVSTRELPASVDEFV